MTVEVIKINNNTEIEVTRYGGGNLKSKIPYVNGVKHGVEEWWWENGHKKYEEIWANGKRDGVDIEWWENGQKGCQTTWKDGKEHGVATWWHESGTKQREIYLLADKRYAWIGWNAKGNVAEVRFRSPLTNSARKPHKLKKSHSPQNE